MSEEDKKAERASEAAASQSAASVDPDREAKLKAAAEARAARAVAKAKAEAEAAEAAGHAEPEPPKEPSRRQPELDRIVAILGEALGAGAIAEAYLNELNTDMPTLVLDPACWPQAALLLRDHESLRMNYLRNVSGVDYETHLEVVYHLLSLESKADVAVKLRTDREGAEVPSATPVWSTANWNEREIYDLLGVRFRGHPDLRRIMMPDDWAGHPLRKDYEPLDSEV
ncbi:NADH-quinone oxidoreductase subunit C [Paenibacillus sp. PL2-23]|uniref:NADH-quinone oxidoreductase subunit C n=1 Tax=Paenibacillus sp. PL2-23 TaxID=2100729 RepID=UPI0030F5B52E